MKRLKDIVEFVFFSLFFAAFKTLPLDAASWAGGLIGRSIGPVLPAHRTAKKNLALAFPEMTDEEKRKILTAMWDNLGRNAAELSHLPGNELYNRMAIHGANEVLREGPPVIFFSGHFGNWELTYPIARRNGFPVTLVYRAANNPYVDREINRLRLTQADDSLVKGSKGSIKLLRVLKEGRALAMLVDQKMNDGIPIPFFGRDAMTAPAIAELALRYDMRLIPARIVRREGCHFEAMVYPPLTFEKTGDHEKDVRALMTKINALLESWIREHPEQWFWVHNRWPKT